MYNENDLNEVGRQLKKIITVMAVILVLFLVVAIAFLLRKPLWIGAAFLSIGICIEVFILCVYMTPILSYYKFVRDIIEGRTREEAGTVINVSDQPVYKDNKLFFYEVLISDIEKVERVLLFDANKGKPDVKPGQEGRFILHDNYVVQILNEV